MARKIEFDYDAAPDFNRMKPELKAKIAEILKIDPKLLCSDPGADPMAWINAGDDRDEGRMIANQVAREMGFKDWKCEERAHEREAAGVR